MLSVKLTGNNLEVRFEVFMGPKEFKYANECLQSLTGSYKRDDNIWVVPKHQVDQLNEIFNDKLAWHNSIEDIKGIRQVVLPKFYSTNEGLEDMKLEPRPFQAVGTSFLHDIQQALLADEMGLGKSVQAIGAVHRLYKTGKIKKVLIICPTSLKYQWGAAEDGEINKFTDYKTVVIDGTPKDRHEQYRQWMTDDGILFAVVNYELVRNDLELIKRLPVDVIIADEVHRIKNWASKTSIALKELDAPYKFGLTGTPMQNKPEELFNLFDFLDPTVLGNWWAFRSRYLVTGEKFGQKGVTIGYRNLDELRRRVGPYMLRRMKKEVAPELPEMIINDYLVEMTPEQTKLNEELRNDLMELLKEMNEWNNARPNEVTLREEDRPKHPKEGQSFGYFTMMQEVSDSLELLQMSDSGMAQRYADGLPSKVKSPKLDELEEIVQDQLENGNKKFVIFTQFARMQKLIVERLSKIGKCEILNGSMKPMDRQAAVDRFKYQEDVHFFVSTDAGNYGINLQFASVLVHVDLPWNPAIYDQRCGRIHRIGSAFKEVTIINLISKGGLDEQIQQVLYKKRELSNQIVEKSDQEKAEMNRLTAGVMKQLLKKPTKKKA
jgi:SNF2 family DNA or RNA helicase